MLATPFVMIALMLFLGTLLAEATGPWGLLPLLLTLAALAAGMWTHARRAGGTVLSIGVCLLALAMWRCEQQACVPWSPAELASAAAPHSAPQLARLRLTGPVRSTASGRDSSLSARLQVRAQLVAVAQGGLWQPRSGAVLLHLWPGAPIAQGDTIVVPVHLRCAPQAKNIGDLSGATWARRRGLAGRAQVAGAHILVHPGPWGLRALDAFRQVCTAHLDAALAPPLSALARALALGDATALADDVREVWADAGMAHLLAVSGLHVALVMGLVRRSLRQLCRVVAPRCFERIPVEVGLRCAALSAGCGFAALSGAGWASMRAVLMAMVLQQGALLGRRPHMLQALSCAAAALVWFAPQALFDVGFVLSFCAVLGLVLWLPDGRSHRAAASAPVRLVPAWVLWPMHHSLAALRLCAAAQMATAPCVGFVFGRLTGTASLVNVAAVPVASLAVCLSLCCALLGPVWGALCVRPCALTLQALHTLAQGAAHSVGASFAVPGRQPIWLGTMLVVCVALTLWRRAPQTPLRRWGQKIAAAAGLGLVALWCGMPPEPSRFGTLQVEHVYVGQGDATLVTLPQGLVMLVDAGGAIRPHAPDPGRLHVATVLRRHHIRRIDVMVLTHPHPDHLGGLLHVARRFDVGALWLNGDGLHHKDVQTLVALVLRQGGRTGPPPLAWQVQGVHLTSHMPLAGTWASANDHSLVLRLRYKHASIVLAGDIEGCAEHLLAQTLPPTDILKVGHHGSRTSSSAPFLAALKPALAVISCGEDNGFGFPHPEALARLRHGHIATWRTDTMGALHLETQGDGWQGTGPHGEALVWPSHAAPAPGGGLISHKASGASRNF